MRVASTVLGCEAMDAGMIKWPNIGLSTGFEADHCTYERCAKAT